MELIILRGYIRNVGPRPPAVHTPPKKTAWPTDLQSGRATSFVFQFLQPYAARRSSRIIIIIILIFFLSRETKQRVDESRTRAATTTTIIIILCRFVIFSHSACGPRALPRRL